MDTQIQYEKIAAAKSIASLLVPEIAAKISQDEAQELMVAQAKVLEAINEVRVIKQELANRIMR